MKVLIDNIKISTETTKVKGNIFEISDGVPVGQQYAPGSGNTTDLQFNMETTNYAQRNTAPYYHIEILEDGIFYLLIGIEAYLDPSSDTANDAQFNLLMQKNGVEFVRAVRVKKTRSDSLVPQTVNLISLQLEAIMPFEAGDLLRFRIDTSHTVSGGTAFTIVKSDADTSVSLLKMN